MTEKFLNAARGSAREQDDEQDGRTTWFKPWVRGGSRPLQTEATKGKWGRPIVSNGRPTTDGDDDSKYYKSSKMNINIVLILKFYLS